MSLVEADSYGLAARDIGGEGQPQLYLARSTHQVERGVRPEVALRHLTEGFLNLEQQMRLWRRQLQRKLGDIERRVSRCESALLLTKALAPRPPVAEAATHTYSDAEGGVEDAFRRLQLTSKALRATVEECARGGASCVAPNTPRTGDWHETASAARQGVSDDSAVSADRAGVFASPCGAGRRCAPKWGMSPTADSSAAVGSGESAGVTPDTAETYSPRLASAHAAIAAELRRGERRRRRRAASSCSSDSHAQSPLQPSSSFSTMTSITRRACSATDSTCCRDWSPFIQVPGGPEGAVSSGAKAAAPEPRMESTATTTRPSCDAAVTASPSARVLSLERRLSYSPEMPKRRQREALCVSAKLTSSAFLFVKRGRKASLAGAKALEPPQNFTGPVFASRPVRDAKARPDTSPFPQLGDAVSDVSAATGGGVPAAPPLYFVSQHRCSPSGSSDDGHEDASEREEVKEWSAGSAEGIFPASAPALPRVDTVWQKVVELAHAEQYCEQLHALQYPPLSMLSSGVLEVSASTAKEM
ncbi:uncharacterized protein Tco025E_08420 [Trypanosoma conorhini]|uniref:Uncharacterized protein n=1 Tax=Trypanosoma conorhini TaxID=83891 RepID=A0A3R7K606_9TRYP|nr:uncharacterized protein Tco025E_08420 [Trypanosoma conorhini]RNF02310.1 hypothetical protein Tco025E_08420 [Trypanosoma conorhini]